MEHRTFASRLLWLVSTCLLAGKGSSLEFRDVLAKNRLSDGELETRIRFKGVTAKETTVNGGNSTGVTFRQFTDGRHFIQLIYDSTAALRDCEYVDDDPKRVRQFVATVSDDLERLQLGGRNVSLAALGGDGVALPEQVRRWMRYGKLRNRCRRVQLGLRQAAQRREEEINGAEEAEQRGREGRRARSIRYVTAAGKRILGGLRTGLAARLQQRVLIFPGMQWCGVADRARKYTDVGEYMGTDMCCRKHDLCKLAIPGNVRRYRLYNSSPITRTHCQCDRSFRTCLKMVDSSDSNLIGKIFFNVVQTKCFLLKPKRVCVERTWWGNDCLKWKVTKKAVLKNNIPY